MQWRLLIQIYTGGFSCLEYPHYRQFRLLPGWSGWHGAGLALTGKRRLKSLRTRHRSVAVIPCERPEQASPQSSVGRRP